MTSKKTPNKTLEDVIVHSTLNTDRLEIAIEKATHRIVTEIDSIPIPSSITSSMPTITPTIIGPGKYDDKLIDIKHEVNLVKGALFGVIATVIGVCVMMMFMLSMLISSVQHLENGTYVPEEDESSGSEQNTSTEEEASPETPDQSHQQSSSGAPQPSRNSFVAKLERR